MGAEAPIRSIPLILPIPDGATCLAFGAEAQAFGAKAQAFGAKTQSLRAKAPAFAAKAQAFGAKAQPVGAKALRLNKRPRKTELLAIKLFGIGFKNRPKNVSKSFKNGPRTGPRGVLGATSHPKSILGRFGSPK